MTLELARQKAAQAWCTSETGRLTMVPELAFAFADILEEAWNSPILGNATTRDLIEEIKTRPYADGKLDYRTIEAENMLTVLQDKKTDLSFSLKEVEEGVRERDARRHTIEGKLSEVEYMIRYLKQNRAEEI